DFKLPLILIIDDDPVVRESMGYVLEQDYRLLICASGEEGIQKVNEEVDAVVLDIKMKGKDGFETFVELKKLFSHLPIIFHSAYQDVKDPYEVINNFRPFGYISKQGGLKELSDTIVSAVEYHAQIRKNEILVQEFRELNATLENKVVERTQSLQETLEQLAATNHQLSESNGELKKTLHQLNDTQTQLIQSEKMAALGGLVAGIAHEVNTPIGVAVTASSFLLEETNKLAKLYQNGEMEQENFTDYLETSMESSLMILRNLNRTAELIRSFKQVATDQSEEAIRQFGVEEYLGEVVMSLRPQFKRTRHSVDIQCDAAIQMESYPGALSQVITNFITNSLNHAFPEGFQGKMNIAVRQEGKTVILTFSDNGQGIPPEHLGRIYEPFFTTKRGTSGTGLGLHITWNLVTQKLQGTLQCSSVVGQGTTFTLRLPVQVPL
ncbi:MAG: response regulator, partial [SAR324 cluster bacterium]|nr:response regulator [SAR324 cluster bacterium]